MGLFGKKEGLEENPKIGSGIKADSIMLLFLLLVGIIAGAIGEHYLLEPFLNNQLESKWSDCKSSLNLVNREIASCYEQLDGLRNQNNPNDQLIPDSNHCTTTPTGWTCTLTRETVTEYTTELTALDQSLESACTTKEGKWSCYGQCMPFYERYCDLPLSDFGLACTDSNQCKGNCIPRDLNCVSACTGTCSQFPLRTCDAPWSEIINGIIETNTAICD